jgi:hypothetical protein
MQVEMLVCIDMIQSEARSPECLKLRCDLLLQLASHFRVREETESESDHVAAEATVGIDKVGNSLKVAKQTCQ